MTFVQRLWRSEVAGLGALTICAAAVAVYGFADAVRFGPTSLISPPDAAWMGFGYTAIIGVLPAVLYGAPIYALLAHTGRVSWAAVVVLGIVPGALALPFEAGLGGWALGCGLVVASITHVLMQRWTRRSNRVVEGDARQEMPSAPHHGL
jgi:hypothetical protein